MTKLFRRTILYLDGSAGGITLSKTPDAVVEGDPHSKQFTANALALAKGYRSSDDHARAESYLSQAERMLEEGNIKPVLRIPILMEMESIYLAGKRNAELEAVRTKLVDNWIGAMGENELVVANNREQLASVLAQEGKSEQAEKQWEAAITTIGSKLGSGHSAVKWALRQRLLLEEKLGQTDAIARTKADLASLRSGVPSLGPLTEVEAEHVGKSVTPPRIVHQSDPKYSEEARKERVQGTIAMSLVVGVNGIPDHVKILQPLGMGLDEAAEAAVRQWVFEPGKKDGIPVPVIANVEVNFRLL